MKIIGEVESVRLRIYQGADLNFDLEWFQNDGTTPINMSAIASQVRKAPGGDLILELTDYITIDGDTPNVAHVSVPASVTADLPVMIGARWDCNAVAADSGEVKKLTRGSVSIRAGITVEGGS